MPWFYCDDCGDTVKKPKIAAHCGGCSASCFTCIDCSMQFDRHSVKGHTQCVTEHEKYALGATKPGGYAAEGFSQEAVGASAPAGAAGGDVVGEEYLSRSHPFKCRMCNVTATSWQTLLGHAQGAKHKRKCKAAAAAAAAPQKEAAPVSEPPTTTETASIEKKSDDAKAAESPKKVKWIKLAKKELKKADGSLSTKKFMKAVLMAAGFAKDDSAHAEALMKKISGTSKFSVGEKKVSLISKVG